MKNNLEIRLTLSLLFIIPVDGELERSDGLTALFCWHDERYQKYNDAEDNLLRAKLIVRSGHGQGYTYRLTQKGKDARIKIRELLGA